MRKVCRDFLLEKFSLFIISVIFPCLPFLFNFFFSHLPDKKKLNQLTSLRSTDIPKEDENKKFQNAEKQTRDYHPQNINNNYRRHLRDTEETFNIGQQLRAQDIYQRPIDELDTPRFPATLEKKEPIFAKIVNPGVKIMRVDRDVEERMENYR